MNGLKKGIDYISKSPNLYRVDKYQQKMILRKSKPYFITSKGAITALH